MLLVQLIAAAAHLWQPDVWSTISNAVLSDSTPATAGTSLPVVVYCGSTCPGAARVAIPVSVCGDVSGLPGDTPVARAGSTRTMARASANSGDEDEDADDDDNSADDEKGDAKSEHVHEHAKMMAAAGGPWIGVQLAPVPRVLASHLKLKGERLMILNVAKNSPADKAGLEQYDVIVEINNDAAPREVEPFMKKVRTFKVGNTERLVVIRGGEKVPVKLEIEKRPAMDSIQYKYKTEMSESSDTQEFRGGVLQRGSNGQWEFHGLPSPGGGKGGFSSNWPFAGAGGKGGFELFLNQGLPPEGQSVVIVESKDGHTIEIRKEPGGGFSVKRSVRNGNDTNNNVTKFGSRKEFQKGDPEAFKVYRQSVPRDDQRSMLPPGANAEALLRETEATRRELEKMLQREHAGLGRAGHSHGIPDADDAGGLRFETDDDGRITVTMQQDDQTLVRHYKNAESLKSQRPDLYKKYQRMNEQDNR